MDPFSTYRYALKKSDKPLLLPYFRDVFQNYKSDYWQDQLRNSLLSTVRPNSQVMRRQDINLKGLQHYTYSHYQKKGFRKILDLHFLQADFPIYEKLPWCIRKVQGTLFILGCFGTWIHASCYASGYPQDHFSQVLIYLPLLSLFVLIVEYTWSICHQAKHLVNSEIKYAIFEGLGYLTSFGVWCGFIQQYDLSVLSNMWGGSYFFSLLLCLLTSFHARYQRTFSLVNRYHSRFFC
jgi:hypothetical protein